MSDIAIKHLISPFLFVPSQTQKKQAPRKCNHDDADCEIAPECAFVCNHVRNATKKRHSKGHNAKKTRRK